MTIAQIMEKMIAFSEGNVHDIDHFIRVWAYYRETGREENWQDLRGAGEALPDHLIALAQFLED